MVWGLVLGGGLLWVFVAASLAVLLWLLAFTLWAGKLREARRLRRLAGDKDRFTAGYSEAEMPSAGQSQPSPQKVMDMNMYTPN